MERNIGLNFGNPERHDPARVLEDLKSVGMCYYGTFPQLSLREQIRLSRCEDGRYNLFATAACAPEEQKQFLERFRSWIQ